MVRARHRRWRIAGVLPILIGSLVSLRAVHVDPDFTPELTTGIGSSSLGSVSAVMPDGRMIFGPDSARDGFRYHRRLFPDGSEDSTFDPISRSVDVASLPDDEQSYYQFGIQAMQNGQLIAGFVGSRYASRYGFVPEFVWLDDFGRLTDVTINLNGRSSEYGVFLPYVGDQFLLLGDFYSVNGVPRFRLVRINGDGSVDRTFDVGANRTDGAHYFVQPDGRILVHGYFGNYGGVPGPGLVRLNSDGTYDFSFSLDSPEKVGAVQAAAMDSKGRIVWTSKRQVYRSDTDGSNTEYLCSCDRGSVWQIKPLADGSVLISGEFDWIGDVFRPGLAKIKDDGWIDRGFNATPILASGVSPIGHYTQDLYVLPNDQILVTGDHTFRLTSDGSIDPTLRLSRLKPVSIEAVAVRPDGGIIVGGEFALIGGVVRYNLARILTGGAVDVTFDAGKSVGVFEIAAMAVDTNGGIWIGGGPTNIWSVPGDVRLERHRPNGSIDANAQFEFDDNAVIRSIAIDSIGRVIIGGRFKMVNGISRNGLARLNADYTLDESFADGVALTGQDVQVNHLEMTTGNGLLVAGAFDGWGTERRWGVLRLDHEGEVDPTFNPNEALAGLKVSSAAMHADGTVALVALNLDDPPKASYHLLDRGGNETATGRLVASGYADSPAILALRDGLTVFSVIPTVNPFVNPDEDPQAFLLGLNRDGTMDPDLQTLLYDGVVTDMAEMSDESIVLAGTFEEIGGLRRNGLARVTRSVDLPALNRPVVSNPREKSFDD